MEWRVIGNNTEELRRLDQVLEFVTKAIGLLDKHEPDPYKLRYRARNSSHDYDCYDLLAKLMFEIILAAGYLKGPADLCWAVQHNSIWTAVFSFHSSKAYKIVQFKLRRLLYDEILRLKETPNFRSSRILGFCLAVLGVAIGKKGDFDREEFPLRKVVVCWAKKYFLSLHAAQPYVAETCLLGSITFDEKASRLVRTYPRGLDLEQHKEYLELDPADPNRLKPRKRKDAGC
jgi:hypothetical protein